MKAKVVQVIQTKSTRGVGTSADPVREVVQYWDFDGNLIAEQDPIYDENRRRHCDSNGSHDPAEPSVTDISTKD